MDDPFEFHLWLGLVLDNEKEVVTVAAVARSQAECHQAAKSRMPGLPLLCIDMLAKPTWQVGAKMASWFQENGISRRDAGELVRKTARSLAKMVKKVRKEHGE